MSERQHTRVGGDVSIGFDRKTAFYPAADAQTGERPDNRKIVGVLVSYTWNQYGKTYDVRQGRTHIGAGDIRGEARTSEVHCPEDHQLSADHALILVQGDNFYIQDLSSSNGTILNGTPIRPEIPEPLPSPAEIKVGETTFTFVRFDVSPAAQVTRAAETAKAPADPRATIAPR